MANYSAAFGYDFYIVPLLAASIDTDTVGGTAANFLDITSSIANDATVSYVGGAAPAFTIGGTAYDMEGTGTAVRLAGLTNAALETDTGSEDVYTYDDETKGFNTSIATTKSFSISLSGVADFADSGYQILRLTEQNTVADALRVKFLRVGPTGVTETVFGYGTLTGYSESNEVTSIVSWECTLTGYGPYGLELVSNA